MSLANHLILGWLLAAATFGLIAFYVPGNEAMIGSSYLIFFVHLPSAISSLILFVVAGGYSAAWLLGARSGGTLAARWSVDAGAAAAVEVGVAACTVTLVTGSIWARAAWGLWWDTSDPRLMTVAILWLTYVGYLALRATLDDPERRARYAAVFGVIATINVPIVHFSLRLFRPLHHPTKIEFKDSQGVPEIEMVVTRWFGVLAFLVLYTAIWRLRRRVGTERQRLAILEERMVRDGM